MICSGSTSPGSRVSSTPLLLNKIIVGSTDLEPRPQFLCARQIAIDIYSDKGGRLSDEILSVEQGCRPGLLHGGHQLAPQ